MIPDSSTMNTDHQSKSSFSFTANSIAAAGCCLFLVSCVSVSLQKNTPVPAKHVVYQAPSSPFEEIPFPPSDKTWISRTNSNTISFLSDCQKNYDPSLEQMQADSISVLEEKHSAKTTPVTFNGRQGLMIVSEGFVDGVPIKMQVLVFKRNACNYTLTYAGVAKNFAQEIAHFEQFLKSFTTP